MDLVFAGYRADLELGQLVLLPTVIPELLQLEVSLAPGFMSCFQSLHA